MTVLSLLEYPYCKGGFTSWAECRSAWFQNGLGLSVGEVMVWLISDIASFLETPSGCIGGG